MSRRALAWVVCSWSLLGCDVGATAPPTAPEKRGPEGTDPGECADGADNDANKLYDCKDPACTEAPACAPSQDVGKVISRHVYKQGHARFVNRIDLPNTIGEVSGALTVTVFENYVKIDKDGGDGVWFVPRERFLYAGRQIE